MKISDKGDKIDLPKDNFIMCCKFTGLHHKRLIPVHSIQGRNQFESTIYQSNFLID